MKKLVLLAAATIYAAGLGAQPWLQSSATGPQKLQDIIDRYEGAAKEHASNPKEVEYENGKVVKEGKNYHFKRWAWYWGQQLDENGYLVSPVRKWNEWTKYKEKAALSASRFKTTDQSGWTFQGPTTSPGGYAGIGRINVIAFHPADANTFIIGSAGGGAWRTTTGGLNWTSLYDDLPVLGVSDIDYNPLNPDVIYLSTGDKDASDTYSIGVLKSADGGMSWHPTGVQFAVTDFQLVNGLLINPQDTGSLLVATSTGISKSFDGGNTWSDRIMGYFKDIVYHPTDTNIVYAASYTSNTSNIYRSADGGWTWQAVTNITGSRRIALAVTPANPAIVKAVISNDEHGLLGIYSSADTGNSFTKIFGDDSDCTYNILSGSNNPGPNSCSGQGWYDLCIAISPLNPDQVLVGGVNTYQSLDGGHSWNMVTQWTTGGPGVKIVHADKHYQVFHPLDPTVLYECNDGGLYKTSDPASTLWNDLSNGLGITQFYRNAVSNNVDFVLGGSQDNGSKRITFAGAYNELTGGDGMDNQIDYTDSSVFYTSIQYGSLRRTTNGGANFTTISNNIPGDPEGDWITPFVIHPYNPDILVAGYDHVFLTNDKGDTWTDISPGFPSTGSKIRRVAMSPAHPDRIFILAGNATIKYTDTYGSTWSTVFGAPSGKISDIHIDPKDPNRLWVAYNGYTATRVAEYNIGKGWTNRNDSLPLVPVHCIAVDSSNGTVYLGTDVTVFYRDTSMQSWATYSQNLPVIEVADLGINYTTNEIWAATYGRGMWKSPRHLMTPPNNVSNIPFAADVITIAPNPNKGSFTVLTSNQSLENQPVTVRVVSYTGSVVMQTEAKFEGSSLRISNGSLARGTYIVEINKGGHLFARSNMMVL